MAVVANEMLDIASAQPDDNSIESVEYRKYESQNPAAINYGFTRQIDI